MTGHKIWIDELINERLNVSEYEMASEWMMI